MDQDEALTNIEVLLVGNTDVGKSSMIWSFIKGKFCERTHFTIGTTSSCTQMKIGGNTVDMTIWDTAGQERLGSVEPNYYRDVQGAMFVYDVTNRNTFKNLETWLQQLHIYRNKTDPVKIIVGNKIDLHNREVSTKEGLKFARSHQALYAECSAETLNGIEGCFEMLVQKILQTPGLPERNSTGKFGSANGGVEIFLGNDLAQKSPSTCCNSS